MSAPALIPCPACNGLNRIPSERLGDAPAPLGVAHWDRGDLRAKLARLVVLLAQREQ